MLITHDTAAMDSVADRIAVMFRGQLVEVGPAKTIIEAPLHPYTRDLINAGNLILDECKKPVKTTFETDNAQCAYYQRCPKAADNCRHQKPNLREIRDNHFVLCHFPLSEESYNSKNFKRIHPVHF